MASSLRPAEPNRQQSRRLAPPSLFVGPPSRNASEPALNDSLTATTREPSALKNEARPPSSSSSSSDEILSPEFSDKVTSLLATPQASSTRPQTSRLRSTPTAAQVPRKPSATTETWRALQSTLEEVELSALSGAKIFGAEHSRALEELRKAQVELARAWARGEGDDTTGLVDGETVDGDGDDIFGDGAPQIGGQRGQDGQGIHFLSGPERRSTVLNAGTDSGGGQDQTGATATGATNDASGGTDFKTEKTRLEQETENDIRLARKRRLANDRYFERVNKGVADVVAKLENVAKKMGGVEMESQEMWGNDEDSFDGASRVDT